MSTEEKRIIPEGVMRQGSKKWLDWRKQYRPASLAAVAIGVAPQYWDIRTDLDLRRHLLDGWEPEIDADTQAMFDYGHQFEGEARAWAGMRHLPDLASFEPVCAYRGRYAASYDGLYDDPTTNNETVAVEIKCPYSGQTSLTWRLANRPQTLPFEDRIPPHYFWQLVQQAWIIPSLDKIVYVVRAESAAGIADYRSIEIDADDLRRNWEVLQYAWERALDGRTLGGDNIAPLVDTYIDAKNASALAVAKEKQAAAALKAAGFGMHHGQTGSVKVALVKRKGLVNWQEIAKRYAPEDIDTDEFRKPETESVRLTITASDGKDGTLD